MQDSSEKPYTEESDAGENEHTSENESSSMQIFIVRAEEKYIKSYNETFSVVVREGKYLSTKEPLTLEESGEFVAFCKENGYPQYFAVNERDEVVGWCDVVHRPEESKTERVGSIGVGLLPDYRDAGIGRILMTVAMNAAWKCGFDKIILTVREDNERAIHLYELLGFEQVEFEFDTQKTMLIGGEDVPIVKMLYVGGGECSVGATDGKYGIDIAEDETDEEYGVQRRQNRYFGCMVMAAVSVGLALGILIALFSILGK
ncbi:MAG: GNAT family N-acetyltransferase [Oscillospiraceae bacterium]|jgi:ribosomal protein S18 acetylase RimI-like enzyme|nr:GNAT family N-acetyltransferase [Oscillospiraceae bacterium]